MYFETWTITLLAKLFKQNQTSKSCKFNKFNDFFKKEDQIKGTHILIMITNSNFEKKIYFWLDKTKNNYPHSMFPNAV